jgi:hypothetical protein
MFPAVPGLPPVIRGTVERKIKMSVCGRSGVTMSERRGARRVEETGKKGAQRSPGARRKPGAKSGGAKPPSAAAPKSPISPSYEAAQDAAGPGEGGDERDRGLRRALFLAELAEARELRRRVAPRRARVAELHARLLRTFRY